MRNWDRDRDRGWDREGFRRGRDESGRDRGDHQRETYGPRDRERAAYGMSDRQRESYGREREQWSPYAGMGEDMERDRIEFQGGMYGSRSEGYASRGPGSWGREGMSSGGGFAREERGREEPVRRGGFAGRGPKGYQRSDERIREEICERLTADDHLDASEIEIRVEGGEATLTGKVRSRHCKRLAEDLTESVMGVRDVHNQIRVRREDGETSRSHDGQPAQDRDQPSRTPNGRREKTT